MSVDLRGLLLRLLREDEEFRLAVMGLIGYADLKSSVDRLVEAVNELTKLAKAHEERLVKVEDRLSRIETAIEELTRAVKSHDERLTRLESAVEELTKAVKAHEERLAKLEERMAKAEDRLTRLEAVVEELAKATRENTRAISELRKAMEHLERRFDRRLTAIENMLNNLTISLEDEANHVVQYLLKQRGIEIRTGVTYFDRKFESDIYGASEQLTIIGDAKVKAGPQTIRRLVRKVRRAMDKYPDRFKGKVVTVLYCLRALPDAIREAESQGIWLIEDMQQRTTLNI